MVRTKKQIIDSLATKSKQNGPHLVDHPADKQNIPVSAQFYAPTVPTSPLPCSIIYGEKTKSPPHSYHPAMISTIPTIRSNPYFEPPPYVANNFWSLSPQSSIQNVLTAGICGKRLESTFSNLNQQEIREMMIDCKGNEDEAILRLITQTGYLEYIRHRISLSNKKLPVIAPPIMHQQILPQRPIQPHDPTLCSPLPRPQTIITQLTKELMTDLPPSDITLTKNSLISNNTAVSTALQTNAKPQNQYKTQKRHQQSSKSNISNNSGSCNSGGGGGRLTLDDALQQIEDSKNNGETDGYVGWSAARLRAFKMIDKNPNSYYYRFNAPGEQQKKGKWTDEENALFLKRLEQVGANSQWGIFSIAIPGRVGYQCSNYYRFMIEMGQLHDPNYVLDEKGKARYLFDKKTEDGAVEKIFRKHSKHGSAPARDLNMLKTSTKKKKQSRRVEDSEDDDDPTFSIKKPAKKKATSKRTTNSNLGTYISNRRITRQSIQLREQEEDDNNDSIPKEQQADHVVPN